MNNKNNILHLDGSVVINEYFEVMDYSMQRGELLIRAIVHPETPSEPETDEEIAAYIALTYNIDIIFTMVVYINIPSYFRGVKIKHIEKANDLYCAYFESQGNIFEITIEGRVFYIVASRMGILKNKLEQYETSLIIKRETEFEFELLHLSK